MDKKNKRKRALVIGIDNYHDNEQLVGCVNDAKLMQQVLSAHSSGKPNFEVFPLFNPMDSAPVLQAIDSLFSGEGDISLLYFSGHGYAGLENATLKFPNDDSSKWGYQGIEMEDIMRLANASKVKSRVIILDCCFAGNMGKSSFLDDVSLLNNGVSVLAACTENERAEAFRGYAQGLSCSRFTKYIYEALKGGAADMFGNINVSDIFTYADHLTKLTPQRPVFKANFEIPPILRKVRAKISMVTLNQIPKLFIRADEELQLNPTYEPKSVIANPEHVQQFLTLQKLEGVGLVEPIGCGRVYYATKESRSCRLTALGQIYHEMLKKRNSLCAKL